MSVLALKIASLQRCVSRAREIRNLAGDRFRTEQNLPIDRDLDDVLAFAARIVEVLGPCS